MPWMQFSLMLVSGCLGWLIGRSPMLSHSLPHLDCDTISATPCIALGLVHIFAQSLGFTVNPLCVNVMSPLPIVLQVLKVNGLVGGSWPYSTLLTEPAVFTLKISGGSPGCDTWDEVLNTTANPSDVPYAVGRWGEGPKH